MTACATVVSPREGNSRPRLMASFSVVLIAQFGEVADVLLGIGMMVAVKLFGHRVDASRAQLAHELLRAGDAAECERSPWNFVDGHATAYAPDDLF